MMSSSEWKIGIQQRVLAAYRVPFFDRIAEEFLAAVQVFAGKPLPSESVTFSGSLNVAKLISSRNIHLRSRNGYLCCWQCGLTDWLRAWRPHVLIMEANPRILSNHVGIQFMRRLHRPIIGWGLGMLNNSTMNYWRNALRNKVLSNFLDSFDAIITYSSKGATDYHHLGIPKEKIFIAPNAIADDVSQKHLETLTKDIKWKSTWKARRGLALDKPIVLYVGRLTKQKQVDTLIRACAQVPNLYQLLIVGDGPCRQELQKLATSLQVPVVFTGSLFGLELARCFVASKVFTLPGRGGLAIHQAMSYGKPVLVSSGDGTEKDLVQEGKNGLFFRNDQKEDLNEKLEWLFTNSNILQAMGQESMRMIRTQFSIRNMVLKFKEAIDFVSGTSQENTLFGKSGCDEQG